MNSIRGKAIDKIIILLLFPLVLMVGCDSGNDCDPNCEGFACGFGCSEPKDRNPPEPGPITNSLDCPSTDFIEMENREICNEEYCVSIVDEYVECERVDCFSVECYLAE